MKIMYWLLVGCFFTASCDTILLINVGGVVRISQLFLALICVGAGASIMQEGRIRWARGSTAISLWLFSQLLFVPLSGLIPLGIQFFLLLAFTIAGVFAVIQLWGESRSLQPLMRMYLLSYIFVALFGLMQFILPLVGLPSPLTIQWLIHGKLARIAGFNYEPSYFATYMMMGWIMLVELRISKAEISRGRLWKWATYAVTASLILSSSKTAWAFMIVEIVARIAPYVWRGFQDALSQMSRGTALVPLPGRKMLLNLAGLTVLVIGTAHVVSRVIDPVALLAGTGLHHTAAHSYNTRNRDARDTLDAFMDDPFIGRSLGGVAIYRAARNGIVVHSIEEARQYWGFPVFFDVLAASGIFGVIPFLVFVYLNTFGAIRTSVRYWPSERAKWLRALARAMIFECMLLMTDQNLLRVYVWFHVTMVALVAYNLEYGPAAETVRVSADVPNAPLFLETSPAK